MKRTLSFVLFATATSVLAQTAPERVYDDAKTIERVAEVSRRDLPVDVLRRIATEDLDLLRAKRADGTYQYAHHEREEAGRIEESFTIRASGRDLTQKLRLKGDFVYRLDIQAPSRRLVVARNRRFWLDRVDLEYKSVDGGVEHFETKIFGVWLEPGVKKTIDLPEIARQATAIIHVKLDEKKGTANADLTFFKARVSDNQDSPYALGVQNVKSILRALDSADRTSVRSLAAALRASLPAPATSISSIEVRPSPAPPPGRTAATPDPDLYLELQSIEDSLTGTPEERRAGLDRLHQLVRRLRPGV